MDLLGSRLDTTSDRQAGTASISHVWILANAYKVHVANDSRA